MFYKCVTSECVKRVLQVCYEFVIYVLQGCNKCVTIVLRVCYELVRNVLKVSGLGMF